MYQWVGTTFWLIIGLGVAINAIHLGIGHLHQPGPGFIFFIASSLMVICGIIDLAARFVYKTGTDELPEHIQWGPGWPKVLLISLALCLYIYFSSILGFLVSTFLLLVFLFKIVGSAKWWIVIVGSTTTTLISFIVFKICLMVPLPVGVLSF